MAVEGTFIAEQKGAACRGRGRPPRPEDNVEKEWKGMEKLTEQNRAEVEAYISAEPEYNVFVQGDLENYGFESKTVEIFGTRAADGALCALLLRYFNNYCLCMSGTAPVEELAAFLQARGAQYLSGKEADVAALAARMPGWKLRGTNLARMDRLAGGAALPEGFSLRMLGPQDAQAVIGLEVQIDEFADSFRGVDREEKVEECRENLTRGGHAFGVYDGDRLVALAETTAENSVSAMVVGVATLPGWRGEALPLPVCTRPRPTVLPPGGGTCACSTTTPRRGASITRWALRMWDVLVWQCPNKKNKNRFSRHANHWSRKRTAAGRLVASAAKPGGARI